MSGYIVVPVCNGSEEMAIMIDDIPLYPKMDLGQFWNMTQTVTGPQEGEDWDGECISDWEEMKALVVPEARSETVTSDVGSNMSVQV